MGIFSIIFVAWLGFSEPFIAYALTTPAKDETSIQIPQITKISPLKLQFLKGEVHLSNNNLEMIHHWTRQVMKNNTPIFIHSFASAPTDIRNLTDEAGQHEAIRIAFNRGLIAKSFLKQCGINEKRLILKAIESNPSKIDNSITITTRNDYDGP